MPFLPVTQKQALSQEVLAAMVAEVSQESPKQLCSSLAVVKEATLESLRSFFSFHNIYSREEFFPTSHPQHF